MCEYQDLKPYWEAWKNNSTAPSDDEEREYWHGMRKIFDSIANGTELLEDSLIKALSYLVDARKDWLKAISKSDNYHQEDNTITLYRGLIFEAAINARCNIEHGLPYKLNSNSILSYSLSEGIARGEAGRVLCHGFCYKIRIPITSVLYFDHLKHPVTGGLENELEVIVFHKDPMLLNRDHVVDSKVPFRAPWGDPAKSQPVIQKWIDLEDQIRTQYA